MAFVLLGNRGADRSRCSTVGPTHLYIAPFALRALAVVRRDPELMADIARFEDGGFGLVTRNRRA